MVLFSFDFFCKKFPKFFIVDGLFATVDHLVNNAGVVRVDLFEDSSDTASIMVIIPTCLAPLSLKLHWIIVKKKNLAYLIVLQCLFFIQVYNI